MKNEYESVLDEPIKKKRVRRTKEELKENYVDPKQMEDAIKKYYETGVLTNELGDMIQKIATRLGYAQNFYRYSYKDCMIGDAVIKMMTALIRKRFKCDSGYNPFSYFTKVAWRAFQNRIKVENKRHEGFQRYQEQMYDLMHEQGRLPSAKNQKSNNSDDFYDEDH